MENKNIETILHDFLNAMMVFDQESINQIKASPDNPLFFSFHTPDARLFLGHDGENLHALTFLIKRIIEKNFNEETARAFTLDINDFYKKKIENLKTTAHMLAERARYFKSSVDVDPMNPYDRRVIHEYLQNYPDINTESVGMGKERHIVIKYVSKEI